MIRGKYVLQNILGTPPPPPPPDVPLLEEAAGAEPKSLRQQLEKHRANPICASCHRNMDPLGFGLENYDAIGRWRDADGKFPVDASGTLPDGQPFRQPAEMRALLLRQLPQFSRGADREDADLRAAAAASSRTTGARWTSIHRAVAADGYRFQNAGSSRL